MNTKPLISIVIPTLGKSPHLRGLLERLQRQRFDASDDSADIILIETLVVANVPSQSLRNSVRSIGVRPGFTFEYLETGRIGVNIARNKGLDRARGDIVLFLDDDAILDEDDFVFRHLSLHFQNPSVAAIGGPYRLVSNANAWDQAYHAIAHDWMSRQKQHRDKASTGQLLGGNLSLKKSKLLNPNIRFDEEITFGGAESGLCQKLTDRGETLLFFDHLSIGHAPHLSVLSFCNKAYLQGAGSQWRSKTLPEPKMKFLNQTAPRSPLTPRQRLYRICFDFGFSTAPFYFPKKNQNKTPKIRVLRLGLFVLLQLHALKNLRRHFRGAYAALASAWSQASR